MPVRSATAISGATCCGPSLRDVSWTCPVRRVMDVSRTAGRLGNALEVPRKCLGSVSEACSTWLTDGDAAAPPTRPVRPPQPRPRLPKRPPRPPHAPRPPPPPPPPPGLRCRGSRRGREARCGAPRSPGQGRRRMAERRSRGRRKQREGWGVSQRRPRGVLEVSQRSQRRLGGASTPRSWPRERSSRKSHSRAAGTSRTAAPARSTATSSGYVGACHWGHVQKATGPDTQPAAPLSSCRPAQRRLPTHTAALNRRGSSREGHAD